MHVPISFSKLRILVCGDLILDEYISGDTSRISPESPVPILCLNNKSYKLGGAANVALNLHSLGVQVTLVGYVGCDPAGDTLRSLLDEAGIDHVLLPQSGFPTIKKTRFISRNSHLLRVDDEISFSTVSPQPLLDAFADLVENFDSVLFSDYDKGTLASVAQLISLCNSFNIPIFVDPKGDDIHRYKYATCLTPNMSEMESFVGPISSDTILLEKSTRLINDLGLRYLLVTRSEKGLFLVYPDGSYVDSPACAREVFDVTGAGDTVISVFAACSTLNIPMNQCLSISNRAAGFVVQKLGTSTITFDQLFPESADIDSHPNIFLSPQSFKQHFDLLKKTSKIVITNGCFDILHPGHLSYLSSAKSLGDTLIILLNSDSSISSLKGSSRPINNFAYRAQMLILLDFVDYVVQFDSLTPLDAISELTPHILVKGGDYSIDAIVGSQLVLESGGTVKSLPYLTSYSTSSLIDRILERHSDI